MSGQAMRLTLESALKKSRPFPRPWPRRMERKKASSVRFFRYASSNSDPEIREPPCSCLPLLRLFDKRIPWIIPAASSLSRRRIQRVSMPPRSPRALPSRHLRDPPLAGLGSDARPPLPILRRWTELDSPVVKSSRGSFVPTRSPTPKSPATLRCSIRHTDGRPV